MFPPASISAGASRSLNAVPTVLTLYGRQEEKYWKVVSGTLISGPGFPSVTHRAAIGRSRTNRLKVRLSFHSNSVDRIYTRSSSKVLTSNPCALGLFSQNQ